MRLLNIDESGQSLLNFESGKPALDEVLVARSPDDSEAYFNVDAGDAETTSFRLINSLPSR